MKIIRLIMVLAVSSLLTFTACDSTDPTDDSKQAEVELTLSQLDQAMGGMAELGNSSMVTALENIPEGLGLPTAVLPKIVRSVTPHNLSKNSLSGRFFETLADTSIADILEMLTALYGTHTYTNDEWVSVGSPPDEILIMYPFIDVTTNTEHNLKIRVYGISIDPTAIGVALEIHVDNVRQVWIELDVAGSDLFGETAIPSSVEVSGGMLTEEGLPITFSLTVTNTNMAVTLSVLGNSLVLSVTGDDLWDSIINDTEPVMTSISLSFGEVELVVNNEEDDAGDVYYSGNKVGNLVAEEAGLFIVFNNGNKANLADMMPNAFALLSSLEGLPI